MEKYYNTELPAKKSIKSIKTMSFYDIASRASGLGFDFFGRGFGWGFMTASRKAYGKENNN
jgi:hypothetical protein